MWHPEEVVGRFHHADRVRPGFQFLYQHLLDVISHFTLCSSPFGLVLTCFPSFYLRLTVCLVLYFILGFLWKKFKQQKEGCDAVPNFLWKDLPSLVADGFRFLVSITCGRGSSSSSGGYEQM